MLNIYEQADRNRRKSWLIIALFVAFVVIVSLIMGYALDSGLSFVGFALIFSGLMSFSSYYLSDKIILTLSNARIATREEFFDYYTVTENLCLSAQIPLPKLYVIEDTAMNAFATGRDPEHAVVCATTGLLGRLNRSELEGVVGHELSHIRNYDIRLMSIVTILVGLVALMADVLLRSSLFGSRKNDDRSGLGAFLMILGLILALLSPLIANLIKLAISRKREFLADASSVLLTKYPNGLISALEKLAGDREPLEAANKATAHLYIVNPLNNHHDAVGWFSGLFATHPPISDRIAALKG